MAEEIMAVNPKPKKGLTSNLIDWFKDVVIKLMYNSSQSHPYLSGNFAPVLHETPPHHRLPCSGSLPECLNGEFVRVGPNPRIDPVAGHHWFDGDGKSTVHVIDVIIMSPDPVAIVDLPHRVPYGFHAVFVTEAATSRTSKTLICIKSLMEDQTSFIP